MLRRKQEPYPTLRRIPEKEPRNKRRGHSKEAWNGEKELTRSLTTAVRGLQKSGRGEEGRKRLLTARNVRKFKSIASELDMLDSHGRSFMSVLTDPTLSEEETLKVIAGCGVLPKSQVRSIDSGNLGSMVTIPCTPTQVQCPFRMVVAGPSMSGKTHLVQEMLRQREYMFTPNPPAAVYWFYAMEDSVKQAREEFEDITFIKDLPSDQWVTETIDSDKGALFIIDDLMGDATGAGKSKMATRELVSNLFTKGSHHKKVSIIFTVQSVFRGQYMRELSLNATQTVAFNNNRDMTHLRSLGAQLFPPGHDGAPFISACMLKIKKDDHGYLWIEHGSKVKPGFQFRTDVFKEDDNRFFVPKLDLSCIDPAMVTDSKPLNRAAPT